MRKLTLSLLFMPLAVLLLAGLYWMTASMLAPQTVDFSIIRRAAAAERKVKYWKAPMDPTYIRNAPGKSPMGMDLVPVYEDDAQSGSTLSIDPVTAQNMGVRTAPVVVGDIFKRIRTVGLIAYEEPRQYSVNARISGWVEKLYVNEKGQKVKQGQPLLEIYSPELVTAQQELILAKQNLAGLSKSSFPEIVEGAKRLLEASRSRLSLWDISSAQIAQIEKSGQVQKRLTLEAPHSGIVSMKMVTEGMHIQPGAPLFQISDLSRVWVYADLYENELPFVKVGQQASVTLPYANEKPRSAKVSYLYPYVDAKTRTVKARLEFSNTDRSLRPDMYVNVEIQAEPRTHVLMIPAEAVLNSGDKQRVFVALGGGKFEPRMVKTGVQGDAGMIEIVSGVAPGETVVTSAQFLFDSESQLREAVNKMLEPKKEPSADAGAAADLFGDEKASSKKKLDDLF
ncbi:efflux RND transporter periplasmic adaptor subunit [Geopsychrobacter electrodiphilus]|uniref:efflux RND transporter periplasmic adaptor subunit n=1 Tax=Geopsychrobacter electrodiphilus TaxID=225196 RepID=UPI0003801407|nr:efflux RND transporter periplasmic adaptor subunit [Geopsychrobacter electrodiphilus]